jgi:hypothetical protein
MAGEWSVPDGYATRSRTVVRAEFATAERGQCLSPGFDRPEVALVDWSPDRLHVAHGRFLSASRAAPVALVVELVHERYRWSHGSPRDQDPAAACLIRSATALGCDS